MSKKSDDRAKKQKAAENSGFLPQPDKAGETSLGRRGCGEEGAIGAGFGVERIMDHEQVEETPRWSGEQNRRPGDKVGDGFYRTDSAGIFTFANPALARIYGVESPQALLGRKFNDFIAPEYFKQLGLSIRSTMHARRPPDSLNGQIVRPDGSRVDVQVKSVSIVKGGQFVGAKGVVREITGRTRAEAELNITESHFRLMFNQASDGMLMIDLRTGKLSMCNPACAVLLGYSQDESIGQDIARICVASDLPAIFGEFTMPDGAGEVTRRVLPVKRKNGSVFMSDISLVRLTIAEKPFILMTMKDSIAPNKAEERIQRQLRHLTAMSGIDRVIAANFDLQLCLSEIVNQVKMELGIDAADILILDSNSQTLEFGAECGFRTKAIHRTHLLLGKSLAGRAVLERQLVHIPNLRNVPTSTVSATRLTGEDFICYYGVPLIAKGLVKGVLEVMHRTALEPDSEWIDFLHALAGQTAIAIENSMLFRSLQRSNLELTLAYDATIEGWSRALDLRDRETEGHTQRVAELTMDLARAFGLSEAELVQVRWGALLHDMGKMALPDSILLKPGPLTKEEWEVMRKHPTFAFEMLSPIRYLQLALDIPYCHHEKWDGTGYPRGIKRTQIPLHARIFAVVDIWDALISVRPYRAAWPEERVCEHIRKASGTHFDPQVTEAFMQMQYCQ